MRCLKATFEALQNDIENLEIFETGDRGVKLSSEIVAIFFF